MCFRQHRSCTLPQTRCDCSNLTTWIQKLGKINELATHPSRFEIGKKKQKAAKESNLTALNIQTLTQEVHCINGKNMVTMTPPLDLLRHEQTALPEEEEDAKTED